MALEPQPGRVGEAGAGKGDPGLSPGRLGRRGAVGDRPTTRNDADRREKVPALLSMIGATSVPVLTTALSDDPPR